MLQGVKSDEWSEWGTTVMLFLVKNSLVEKEVRDGALSWCNGQFICRDATASSSVARVRVKVFAHFHAVTAKRHSSMQNWLYGLPGPLLLNACYFICLFHMRYNTEKIKTYKELFSGVFSLRLEKEETL
jgi:hypothetical protein